MTKRKARQYMVMSTYDIGEDKTYELIDAHNDVDKQTFGDIVAAKAAIVLDREDNGYAVEYKILEVIQTVPVKPDFGG